MSQVKTPQSNDLYLEGAFWRMVGCEDAIDASVLDGTNLGEPAMSNSAQCQETLTGSESQHYDRKPDHSLKLWNDLPQKTKMTVAEFVEHKFVPEHVALKGTSGRAYYQAMLKHVLPPEEVDRIFRTEAGRSKRKLETVLTWPYLDKLRLCDANPDHVYRLTSAALERGYSTQTAKNIRNVVSAIFSLARRDQYFMGDNPVRLARFSGVPRKVANALTIAQAREAFGAMKYPEKEMMLMTVLTGMNISEICGLKWNCVNLTEAELNSSGELISPMTIIVRRHLYRGESGSVKKSRIRNLPIPEPLLQVLSRLKEREKFTMPDDYVLVSRVGTPINETNIGARRLKPIAIQLGVPSISWNVIRRNRKVLAPELLKWLQDSMAMDIRAVPPRGDVVSREWRCRTNVRRTY